MRENITYDDKGEIFLGRKFINPKILREYTKLGNVFLTIFMTMSDVTDNATVYEYNDLHASFFATLNRDISIIFDFI